MLGKKNMAKTWCVTILLLPEAGYVIGQTLVK